MSIPLVMSSSGAVATSADTLRQNLLDLVAASNPDYTANLPGSLIEDLASTAVGALTTIDQARVDAVNDVTPYGANAFVLAQFGAQMGIPQGVGTNTSVYVKFYVSSGGTAVSGFVIPAGFLVSDGTYQYSIQDGGVTDSTGYTGSLYAVATQSGSWAVAATSVNTVVTSVASGYTVTVTNAEAGISATSAESVQDYRTRVQQASQITGQGTPAYIKSLLEALPNVTARLVSVQQAVGGWEVICGGGDEYSVAGAIYLGVLDLSSIVGSSTTARNLTASIIDGNDSYSITYVNPPLQTTLVAAVWNTNLANFTAGNQVSQLAAPAIQSYINSITVGQPINVLELNYAFQEAVSSVLPTVNLTTLDFTVTINGTVTPPNAGTSIIPSDSESYFYSSASDITVTQG